MKNILTYIQIFFHAISVYASKIIDIPVTEVTYLIENITSPEQIIWKSNDEILLVEEEKIYSHIISNRETSFVMERNPNDFVGIDDEGNIIFCSIEHFTISSMDEFSTKFTVLGKEYYFFETIRPIFLNEEEIIAVTAMDFLEKHFYKIMLNDGSMEEIHEPKRRSFEINIQTDMYVKKVYGRDSNLYIIQDIFGNLYVYIKRVIRIDELSRYILTILDLV